MDQDLIRVLDKIANALEENTTILNRIADHYDGVVPVMTRNANRVEKAHMEVEAEPRSPLDKMYGQLFGEPETTN
jgi:hypothetical protein